MKVGVEGTGSYGAGLCRSLLARGIEVVEVDCPNRKDRTAAGKSDTIDAVSAARGALSGQAQGLAQRRDRSGRSDAGPADRETLRRARNGCGR